MLKADRMGACGGRRFDRRARTSTTTSPACGIESSLSLGLEQRSEAAFADARARIPREVADGWSLHVVDDDGRIAALPAFAGATVISTSCSLRPNITAAASARCCQFTRQHLPDEIWLRCALLNENAWRWHEREGFVFEREEPHPSGWTMRYYRRRR
jgi:hypothetical protein